MLNKSKGASLVKLLVPMAVVVTSAALATPAWERASQQRELQSTAEALAFFMNHAQSTAVRSNEAVIIKVKKTDDGLGICALAETDGIQNPKTQDSCATYPAPSAKTALAIENMAIQGQPVDGFAFMFDPVRGMKLNSDGSDTDNRHYAMTLQTENAQHRLQVEVSATGRVRICNPEQDLRVNGYQNCI